MKIRFLYAAQKELDEAVEWYNDQSDKLGLQFLNEVNGAIKRIHSFPYACVEIEDGIRRCLVKRFPYGVIYGLDMDQERLVIIAVAHLHRKPGYWKDRVAQ